MKKVLIKFRHGLGDCVQLQVVLRHIQVNRPNWKVDVASGKGKHTCFHGLCENSYILGQQPPDSNYNQVFDPGWYENYNKYKDRPNTKVTNSLAEEFHIDYDAALGSYKFGLETTDKEHQEVYDYYKSIGAQPVDPTIGDDPKQKMKVVVIHYQGNTSPDKKNLHHHHVKALIHTMGPLGYKFVILDWDGRSNLANHYDGVYIPHADHPYWGSTGTGDARKIKLLIDQASLFLGIDSGPGHVAGASETPAIIVWLRHHPFQFYDLCSNVTHLIPDTYGHYFEHERAKKYFERHYKHEIYSTKNRETISTAIFQLGYNILMGKPYKDELVEYRGMKIRAKMFSQDQEIVEDVWCNDCYQVIRHCGAKIKDWKLVVDIGSQTGTFSKMIHNFNPNCRIICVEPSKENVRILRENCGSFAEIHNKAITSSSEFTEGKKKFFVEPIGEEMASTGCGSVVGESCKVPEGFVGYDVDLCTLQQLIGDKKVDCVKSDCEGGEYLFLEREYIKNCTLIVGEWHGCFDKFNDFRKKNFPEYDFGDMSEHNHETTNGIFHLVPK